MFVVISSSFVRWYVVLCGTLSILRHSKCSPLKWTSRNETYHMWITLKHKQTKNELICVVWSVDDAIVWIITLSSCPLCWYFLVEGTFYFSHHVNSTWQWNMRDDLYAFRNWCEKYLWVAPQKWVVVGELLSHPENWQTPVMHNRSAALTSPSGGGSINRSLHTINEPFLIPHLWQRLACTGVWHFMHFKMIEIKLIFALRSTVRVDLAVA